MNQSDLFGFERKVDNAYTRKTSTPIYEPTGERPRIVDIVDKTRYSILRRNIARAKEITDDEREFLLDAATRHYGFDYRKVAEYYAHAGAEMQRLMEESALVIIDFDRAIELGYVRLQADLSALALEEARRDD